jgi:endonuclease III
MKQLVTIEELFDILEDAVKDFPETLAEHTFHIYKSPFFTLVSTVLSARTKDSLTIKKLPALWNRAKTPQDYAEIPSAELEQLLRPINFFATKAKHLIELGRIVHTELADSIPESIEELVKLPGVGRKTANLVVSVVFDTPSICVDTHVHRIMNHIGYVTTKTPEQTEAALRKKLPLHLWQRTNRILVLVGQNLANHLQINDPENILNHYTIKE